MYSVLNIGKTGLKSMQTKMDAIADELANVNTNGYKRKDVNFQELLNSEAFEINTGSKSGVGKISFEQGNLMESPSPYHMAIEGKGFFGVLDQDNNLMLTRNGGFHIDEAQTISDDSGYPLVVDDEGKAVLFYPENLDSLISLGEGRYLPSENVELYDSIDNADMFGKIVPFALEGSNVEITMSMAEMISTQRAYSLNSKAVQTTDEMMSIINGIKR